jgi:hypothetical protein
MALCTNGIRQLHGDWFDDFDDGTLQDCRTVCWCVHAAYPAEVVEVREGDLVITPPRPNQRAGAWPCERLEGDVSVRTRARCVGAGWLNVDAHRVMNGAQDTGYFLSLAFTDWESWPAGGVVLLRWDPASPDGREVIGFGRVDPFDPADPEAEYILQLDVQGDEVVGTVWRDVTRDGPPAVRLRAIDNKYRSGYSAVSFTSHADGAHGVFRHVWIAESPIAGQPPRASFTAEPETGQKPLEVTFDASASTPQGSGVSYRWDFGDGGGTVDDGPLVIHTYEEVGEYDVLLQFTDDRGLTSQTMKTIEVLGDVPPVFMRGDCKDDGKLDISDAICILDWLFQGGAAPGCVAVNNTNGDETADISDAVYLLAHLFLGGPAPVAPYPDCGAGLLPADQALGCETPPESCVQ